MNKVAQRLLVFVVGIPAALSLTLIEWGNHLPLQIVMLIFSLLGAVELYRMFERCGKALMPLSFVAVLDALIMVSPYVLFIIGLPTHYVCYVFVLCVMLIFAIASLKRGQGVSFEHVASSVGLAAVILFYCGFMFSFMPRLALEKCASEYLLLFLIIVFICDSGAWFFGMLLGKGNRNIVAASPNKSAAGFIGGMVSGIAVAVAARCALSSLFAAGVWRYALLAFVVSLAAIVGDLVESTFKRSAGVKDSGHLMLGRGGILDSIDSIIFSVPVYYLVARYLI